MPCFFVYMLKCRDQTYYVGQTDDLNKRISQHQNGDCKWSYTYTRRPVELVFAQTLTSRQEAKMAEVKIKDWSRKKKEALMAKDWNEVSRLAKKKF